MLIYKNHDKSAMMKCYFFSLIRFYYSLMFQDISIFLIFCCYSLLSFFIFHILSHSLYSVIVRCIECMRSSYVHALSYTVHTFPRTQEGT